jgi:hypothetical protein
MRYTAELKQEAVNQLVTHDYPVSEVSQWPDPRNFIVSPVLKQMYALPINLTVSFLLK